MHRHGPRARRSVTTVGAVAAIAAVAGVVAFLHRRTRVAEVRAAALRTERAQQASRASALMLKLRAERDEAACRAQNAESACDEAQAEARAQAAAAQEARAQAAESGTQLADAQQAVAAAEARCAAAVRRAARLAVQLDEVHKALAGAGKASALGASVTDFAAADLSVAVISRAGSAPTHQQLQYIQGALEAIDHPKGTVEPEYIADAVRKPYTQVVVHRRNGTPVGLACFHIELRARHGRFDAILICVDLLLGSQGASASTLLLAFAGWWGRELRLALRSGINPFPRHASASARAVQIWGKLHAVASAVQLYMEQGWEQQGTAADGLIRMFKPLTAVNVPEPDGLRASDGAHVNVPCKVVQAWKAPLPAWRHK